MESQTEKNTECCPEFNPVNWDDKLLVWDNKKFIKDKVCTIFYMPMNFGSVMKGLDKIVKEAGATMPDWLCLSDHTSKWNMDVYLAVDKEITGADNTSLNGKFYSKVYEGAFKDSGKWCKDFDSIAKTKGYKTKKQFMWYTTCPKCAKKYGNNYVVILSEIE